MTRPTLFSHQLGKLDPIPSRPRLKFKNFWTGITPDHPLAENYQDAINDYQELGNDLFGVCVPVGMANLTYLVTTYAGTPLYPNQQDVFDLYKTQNPAFIPNPNSPIQDNGMVVQKMLEYCQKTGWPNGRRIIAFASVNIKNPDEIRAASAIFGGVLLGMGVQRAQQQQFDAGQVWDYVPGSTVEGGHCVFDGGYASTPKLDFRFVTWKTKTAMTQSYWDKEGDECWVVVQPENLLTKQFQQGVTIDILKSDFYNLTGKVLVVPTPTPVPVPPPTPTPPPAPSGGCSIALATSALQAIGSSISEGAFTQASMVAAIQAGVNRLKKG